MSKWGQASASERQNAPANIFCGPNRSFPVADRADYDNAVRAIGRAGGDPGPIKTCLKGKARSNGWPIPETWMSVSAFSGIMPTIFALEDGEERSDTVVRRGKIFEAGDYPDKQFACSVEDLFIAASNFSPVDNDLEHMPTILSGKLGRLTSVSVSEDGGSLMGEVELPRWLHEAIGDAPIKTSLSWDKETMGIVGNALVIEPRVPDAALLSAFSAAGGDLTGCDAPASTDHNHEIVIPALNMTFQKASGPQIQTGMALTTTTGNSIVSIPLTIPALLTGTDQRPATATPPGTPVTVPDRAEEDTVSFAESEEYKAMQAQIAAQTAQLTALTAENTARGERERARDAEVIRERAGMWADQEIAAFRALPAERGDLVAAYVDAATDDAAAPRTVQFSVAGESKEGTRTDALRARHAARVPHSLTQEQLRDGTIMMAQRPEATTAPVKMNADRKKYLMELTGFAMNN